MTAKSQPRQSSLPNLQTILNLLIPAVLLYIFAGSPGLPPSISALISLSSTRSSSLRPSSFSDENLRWAAENLAFLPGHDTQDPQNISSACRDPGFRTHVYSREPLVLYLEGFLSPAERDAVTSFAAPNFSPSKIHNGGTASRDTTIRNSEKATLPLPASLNPSGHPLPALNATSRALLCIYARAAALQGWRPDVFVEALNAQRYRAGGHYAHHYDGVAAGSRGGRVSSIMAWLAASPDLRGGGTEFPRLPPPADRSGPWCEFVDCAAPDDRGTVFLPREGNAVYWENMAGDGRGFEETWHAGLPVEQGEKVGLNVWSWWQPGLGRAAREWRAAPADGAG